MKPTLIVRRTIMLALLAYGLMCAYLYLFQRAIIYLPADRYSVPSPSVLPGMKEVKITTQDKIALHCWYQPPSKAEYPTILYLHGNRGGLLNRTDDFKDMVEAGYGVLALEYRGYSGNDGSPSEQGLYKDGRAAMEFLTLQGVPPADVVVMGHSLGTGVAVQLAVEFPVRSLVLLAPYTWLGEIGAARYWYAPVSLLLKDRFDSIHKVAKLSVPLFIFHGKQDQIIPFDHAKRLYASAHSPKKLVLFAQRDHNDLPMRRILHIIDPSR